VSDGSILKTFAEVAGIGGIALAVLLLIFRDVIRKNIFPKLPADYAYRIIRLIVVLTFTIAMTSIGGWIYLQVIPSEGQFANSKPVPRSPEQAAVLDRYPRSLTLVWDVVPNAVAYNVDIQMQINGPVENSVEWIPLVSKTVSENRVEYEFGGGNWGRWQVSAINRIGEESKKSDWRTFKFAH
jgi:hypothetical protein